MKKKIININKKNDINNFYHLLWLYKIIYRRRELVIKYHTKISKDKKKEFEEIIHAFNIKDKNERLEYVYFTMVDNVNADLQKNNYCEFDENETCIFNRAKHTKWKSCCRKCPYLGEHGCTENNFACKYFFCYYIRTHKKIPNYSRIRLFRYYLTPTQKFICTDNFWTPTKEILFYLKNDHFLSYITHAKKFNE